MSSKTDPGRARLAMFLATGCGLGYLPIAPGSWGALGGVALALIFGNFWRLVILRGFIVSVPSDAPALSLTTIFYAPYLTVLLLVAAAGVWAAERAEQKVGRIDPRVVVIDEVSGQMIAVLGALDWARFIHARSWEPAAAVKSAFLAPGLANWKYLLAGFILFRGLDTWKPFPASRAEQWRGGWGIMADDWIAGIYTALVVWLARQFGF